MNNCDQCGKLEQEDQLVPFQSNGKEFDRIGFLMFACKECCSKLKEMENKGRNETNRTTD
jgi:hypothetical protein